MSRVYVSLGCNCTVASQLRNANKRTSSYPLDWLFTYHNVHKLFANDFKGYLQKETINQKVVLWPDGVADPQIDLNKENNTVFMHQDRERGEQYDTVIQRRVDRLLDTLRAQDKEVIFIRRGHPEYFHKMIPIVGFTPFEDTISEREDMERLVDILRTKYPKLKFKIYLYYNCICKPFEDCNTEYLYTERIPAIWAENNDNKLRLGIESATIDIEKIQTG